MYFRTQGFKLQCEQVALCGQPVKAGKDRLDGYRGVYLAELELWGDGPALTGSREAQARSTDDWAEDFVKVGVRDTQGAVHFLDCSCNNRARDGSVVSETDAHQGSNATGAWLAAAHACHVQG